MLGRDSWARARVSGDRALGKAQRTHTGAEAVPRILGGLDVRAEPEPVVHVVCCPYCGNGFDLFAAAWCTHQREELSKICPKCRRCMCEHPAYAEPLFWKDAPAAFQKRGFRRLFMFYL